ncbi:CHAT domain-containing protein [Flindersiella endophytica]
MDVVFRVDLVEAKSEWVIVCESSAGGRVVRRLDNPFAVAELETLLEKVETNLLRSAASVITRRAKGHERVVKEFGERLTGIVLGDDARLLFDRSRRRAKETNGDLRVLVNPNGPLIARIPWEFLADPLIPDDYLALRVPVVRTPHLPEGRPPLEIEPPLRVLGVISRPTDLAELDVEGERDRISQAFGQLSSGLVELTWLPGDRWRDLATAVRNGRWHVLHFIGHGGFDEGTSSGYIELTDDAGAATQVPAADLARLVAGNDDLRMVVLNACESAAAGTDGVFSSTAAKLMRDGVPTVVAMQYEITDPAALVFSCSFYESIARGSPIDRAVTLARESVKMALHSLEWATPVLFLASGDVQTFVTSTYSPHHVVQPEWTERAKDATKSATPDATPAPVRSAAREPAPAPTAARTTPAIVSHQPRRTGPEPQPIHQFAARDSLFSVALGPKSLLAAAGEAGVHVLSSSLRELSTCSLPQAGHARRVAWSPWPRHLASMHDDCSVVVWDLESATPLRVLRVRGPRALHALAFSPDGHWIAVTGSDLRVHIYDVQGVEALAIPVGRPATFPGIQQTAPSALPALQFTSDGDVLVGGSDGLVRRYDHAGRQLMSWQHPQPVVGLTARDDRLIAAGFHGQVLAWTPAGRPLHDLDRLGAVRHPAVSPNGTYLAGIGDDSQCHVWGQAGSPVATYPVGSTCVGVTFAGHIGRTDRVIVGTVTTGVQAWPFDPPTSDRTAHERG